MLSLLETSLLVGLLYCLFTVGLSISFRVINYPDLTLEGSAVFGGATCFLLLENGFNPVIGLIVGLIAGAVAGCITGLLHIYANVSKLLSGIITTSILYAINIRLLGGKSNGKLSDTSTIFDYMSTSETDIGAVIFLLVVVALTLFFLWYIFKIRLGYHLRVLGDNEKFLLTLGKSPKKFTLIGLAIGNGLVGLAGALLVQYKTSCDVNMSFGLLVSSLAAMMLGETVFNSKSIFQHLLFCVIGTIVYNILISLVLFSWSSEWEKYILGSDVRLFTGILLLGFSLVLKYKKKRGVSLFNSHW